MNKAKLIEALQERINREAKEEKLSKKQTEKIIDTVVDIIIEELVKDHEVSITGFGSFSTMTRYARGGVNPRNPQERITIPAVRVAKFKTGKNLKEALKK